MSQLTIQQLMPFRHELARALRNSHFELTEDGSIFLPRAGLKMQGVFTHKVNGRDERIDPNLVVNEGLRDILNVMFANQTADAGLFISLFINNVAPASSLTAATYASTMGEFTNYTQTVRPTWTVVALGPTDATSIGNDASVALFTLGTGGGSIWGAALHGGASAKSATSGNLIAATRFAQQRTNLLAADQLSIQYDIVGSSS